MGKRKNHAVIIASNRANKVHSIFTKMEFVDAIRRAKGLNYGTILKTIAIGRFVKRSWKYKLQKKFVLILQEMQKQQHAWDPTDALLNMMVGRRANIV